MALDKYAGSYVVTSLDLDETTGLPSTAPQGLDDNSTVLMSAVSTAANANSTVLDMGGRSKIGFQVVVDNTSSVGVVLIQSTINGTTWVDEVFLSGESEITVSSGTDVDTIIHLADLGSKQMRVRWEGSGTGTITVTALLKVT